MKRLFLLMMVGCSSSSSNPHVDGATTDLIGAMSCHGNVSGAIFGTFACRTQLTQSGGMTTLSLPSTGSAAGVASAAATLSLSGAFAVTTYHAADLHDCSISLSDTSGTTYSTTCAGGSDVTLTLSAAGTDAATTHGSVTATLTGGSSTITDSIVF